MMNSNKYKTVLCKHFGQTGTCSYGDKCQFAHGFQELKNTGGNMMGMTENKSNKQPPNPSNFKIVKCKNWEANGTCKYGSVCTFAHGDTELRTKSDNNLQMSENAITMDTGFMPVQGNPYLMQDPSYIYNLMLQQQMYEMQMGGGMNQQGGQQNHNMFNQGQGNNTDVNLNDMNNPYFMGMMQQQSDPSNMNNMNSMNNPNINENMNNMNQNNLNNMYMGGPQ